MEFKDRVTIVTGGASGLGGATTRSIVKAGGKVLIADVNDKLGEAMVAELGANVQFVKCDVTNEKQAAACIETANQMGTLAGLVNCAGVGTPGKTVGRDGPLPLADFTRVVGINLIGTFNMIRLAAAAMAKNEPNAAGERGVVINTASVAAYDGQIGQAAYAASKGGIVGMTLPIARDLAREAIRVMTIAPGLFLTPLLEGLPQAAQDSLGKQVPFPPRLGHPDEFAMLVGQIFANPMLNGETIRLDGAIRMAPK